MQGERHGCITSLCYGGGGVSMFWSSGAGLTLPARLFLGVQLFVCECLSVNILFPLPSCGGLRTLYPTRDT